VEVIQGQDLSLRRADEFRQYFLFAGSRKPEAGSRKPEAGSRAGQGKDGAKNPRSPARYEFLKNSQSAKKGKIMREKA
jgi:hypothetical protein